MLPRSGVLASTSWGVSIKSCCVNTHEKKNAGVLVGQKAVIPRIFSSGFSVVPLKQHRWGSMLVCRRLSLCQGIHVPNGWPLRILKCSLPFMHNQLSATLTHWVLEGSWDLGTTYSPTSNPPKWPYRGYPNYK